MRNSSLILTISLIGSLSWPLPALAQIQRCASAGPPEKTQTLPLFPKHRRGVYRNNQQIDVIDATPQSPPLEIDDPGVPDNGEFEINLLTLADINEDARHIDIFRIDANYGFAACMAGHDLPTQLKIEVPLSAAREGSTPYQFGLGSVGIGLKFNFYNDDNRGVRVSIYPQGELSTSSSAKEGITEEGQALVLPLLVAKEFTYVTAVANAGIDIPFHAPDSVRTTELGLGFGSAFFRKLAVMGDVRSSSTLDFKAHRLVAVDVGAIYGVRHEIWYLQTGRRLVSPNGTHTFFAFGMKLLIDTARKP